MTSVGESEIAYCENCDMAATTERAACVDAAPETDVEMLPLEKVHTPGTKTIEEVAEFLGLPKEKYRIPELVLKDRIRSKEKPDTLPFETLQLNQLIDGKISFSETKDYGEVEIWTKNDRVVVSITGVDDEGAFTAAATCLLDDFMKGEDKFIETFIGSVLYYNKIYQED